MYCYLYTTSSRRSIIEDTSIGIEIVVNTNNYNTELITMNNIIDTIVLDNNNIIVGINAVLLYGTPHDLN